MSTKFSILGILILVVCVAGFGQIIHVREGGTESIGIQHNANSGKLLDGWLVGQTFKANQKNLAGIAVMMATYSNRNNTKPVVFHLRQSPTTTDDLRTVTVSPTAFRDNQYYRFDFAPLPDSLNKTYFYFLMSPGSTKEDSITVDTNTKDPYPNGSAYISDGQGTNGTNPFILAKSGKQSLDTVFSTYYLVSLQSALYHQTQQSIHIFITTWPERQNTYHILAFGAAAATIFLLLIFYALRKPQVDGEERNLSHRAVVIVMFLLLAFGLYYRVFYAQSLPVTNDEGNYLYDARALHYGVLAGGDGYVKAPVMVAWVALWESMLGPSILSGRLASITLGTLSIIAFYFLGRELKNARTGLLSAATWALFGTCVVTNIYVHTQTTAIFFGAMGIATVWLALHGSTPRLTFTSHKQGPSPLGWFILAGILLGLGVASRKSVLALGLVPLIMILAESKGWKLKIKNLLYVGIGFIAVLAIFFGITDRIYGREGVLEAIGINSIEDGAIPQDPAEAQKTLDYSLKGMTPFFRESVPLIGTSLLGWGFAMEYLMAGFVQRFARKKPRGQILLLLRYVIPKLGWLAPLFAYWWAFNFFFEYEGSAFMGGGMTTIWYAIWGILLIAALWPRMTEDKIIFNEDISVAATSESAVNLPPNVIRSSIANTKKEAPWEHLKGFSLGQRLTVAFLLPAWFGGLAFLYANWIKFHANYIGEFLPPLAIMSGYGIYELGRRLKKSSLSTKNRYWPVAQKLVAVAGLIVLFWAIGLSNYITFMFEHTGTFDQRAANEAATWAKANIPADQSIFTGAALIPYLSDRRVTLDIAHPRWYGYDWISSNTVRITTFLPPQDKMLTAFQQANWFLSEKQTFFSFTDKYAEIEKGLAKDWVAVKGIDNGDNTLTFYKRIHR